MKNDSGINGDFPDVVGTDEEMEQEGSDSYVSSYYARRKNFSA